MRWWRPEAVGAGAIDLVESPMVPTKSEFGVRNPPPEVIAYGAEGCAEQLDLLRGVYL